MRWLTLPVLLVALVVAAPEARAEYEAVEAVEALEPFDAIGYRKGRRLKLKLVQIGWAAVEINTAKAFLAMREAALADGVELYIRSGFRDHETQRWLYQAWREGWGNKAARPGHSNHQSGRALDLLIDEPAIFEWLEKHAKKFGFKRTVRGEPWHWEYTKPPRKKKKRARR